MATRATRRTLVDAVLSFLRIRERITGYSQSRLDHAAWPDSRAPRKQFERIGAPLPQRFQSLIETLTAEGFSQTDIESLVSSGLPGYTIQRVVNPEQPDQLDFSLRRMSGSSTSSALTLEQLEALASGSDI